jgi:hypothetical protein
MKLGRRIRDLFKRTPAQQPSHPREGPLREFVYLDDVSVDSLVQSVRHGTLDQITETHLDELQAELEGKVGATNLVTSAEVRSRVHSTMSDSSQALRRVGIQARFGELHRIVRSRRALRPADDEAVPQVNTAAQLRELANRPGEGAIWAVPASALQRGKVIELDVELGSEPLFHMVEAMHQVLELWPEDPQTVGLDSLPDQGQAQAMSQMISVLLGGLVPVRSRALHFEVATVDGETWLVHPSILDGLPATEVIERRPVDIVGAAAHERFWKDRRRVVFAGARYRVMARLVMDGVTEDWAPVKMVDTFKGFAPGFSEGIDAATRQGQALLEGRDPAAAVLDATGVDAAQVIEHFTQELAARFGSTGTVDHLREAGVYPAPGTRIDSLAFARPVLDPIAAHLLRDVADPDVQVLSEARLAAYQSAQAARANDPDDERPPALIEVEFIAIYW